MWKEHLDKIRAIHSGTIGKKSKMHMNICTSVGGGVVGRVGGEGIVSGDGGVSPGVAVESGEEDEQWRHISITERAVLIRSRGKLLSDYWSHSK